MPKFVCEAFATEDQLVAVVCEGQLDGLSGDDIQAALDDAADMLFVLSGHRFWGVCERTIRPCRERCFSYPCGCCTRDSIPLPDAISITSVKVDGATLDPSTYELWSGGPGGVPSLVKVSADGERPTRWPGCQKLYRETTEEDTFEIVYEIGLAPGITERSANIEYALHLLGVKKGSSIQVLAGVDGISGGGVSVTVDEDDNHGATLPAVASFVSFWNPDRNRTASGVFAPEINAW